MADHQPTDDPYAKFLGIVTDTVPPDHYALLGLERFDTDDARIDNAAKKQATRLHQLASGPDRATIQKLMGEVAVARRTLADPDQKREYDEQLRNPISKTAAEKSGKPVGPKVAISIEQSEFKKKSAAAKKNSAKSPNKLLSYVATGVLLIVIGMLAFTLITRKLNPTQRRRAVATELQQTQVLEELVKSTQQSPPGEQADKKIDRSATKKKAAAKDAANKEAVSKAAARKVAAKKRAERRAAKRKRAEKKAAIEKQKAEDAKKKANQLEEKSD